MGMDVHGRNPKQNKKLSDFPVYERFYVMGFTEKWEMLNIMVGLMKTDYDADDLTYERLAPGMGGHNPDIFPEPSGGDSY